MLSNPMALESVMHRVELNFMLAMLVDTGVVDEKDAIKLCLDLAEFTRGVEAAPNLRPHVDMLARQYEDIASKMGKRPLLPRDPTD